MESDILKKLKNHIAYSDLLFSSDEVFKTNTKQESWVLYFLVEIRKLLENSSEKSEKFKVLRFYCDWAVHIKMDRSGAKKVLEKISQGGQENTNICAFITLRDELVAFLNEFNLPNFIIKKPGIWFEFRNHLIQILKDCPLESSVTNIIKLSLTDVASSISKDYFIHYEAQLSTGKIIDWNIMLGDYGKKRREERERISNDFNFRLLSKVRYRQNKLSEKNNL